MRGCDADQHHIRRKREQRAGRLQDRRQLRRQCSGRRVHQQRHPQHQGRLGRSRRQAARLPNDLGESETAIAPTYDFNTITNALLANANSPVQTAADATLPSTDVTNGGIFDIGTAEAKALGLIAGNNPANDGWVGFSNTATWSYAPNVKTPGAYYLIGTIEHEITEVMGRGSSLGGVSDHFANAWGVEDLFRYSAPGVRELATGGPHSTGYFSIDNGITNLGNWNNDPNNGDLGDWYSGFGPAGGGPGTRWQRLIQRLQQFRRHRCVD